jgi:uncharacterized protein (DUF362 family)
MNTVAIVRFDEPLGSVARAIELCDGFKHLADSDRVLLKPNITFCGRLPPYGMVTTSVVMEALILLLLEHGCRSITIGEGSVNVAGSSTGKGYRWTGMARLARKYGAKLVDFNQGPFKRVNLGSVGVQVSEAALETDFLVNVPVLKTHGHTRVSLGLKNLKGCLSPESKSRMHGTNRLDHMICLLAEVIRSDLTIIDGVYMLEMGPDTLLGTAQRKDLIIASRDAFACDVVGSAVLGFHASDIGYLKEYAQRQNRCLDAGAIQVKGEIIADVVESPRWRADTGEELLAPEGVTGLSVPYSGETLCSRCYATMGSALLMLCKDNPNTDFGNVELYCGKVTQYPGDIGKVLLYGDCAIKSNRALFDAARIAGCPPGLTKSLFAISKALLGKRRLVRAIALRSAKLVGIGLGIHADRSRKWDRYSSREFDSSHFAAPRGTLAKPASALARLRLFLPPFKSD